MDTRKQHERASALERLHHWHLTGEGAPDLSPDMQHELLSERLIQFDEYGQIRMTERGEQHLRHLKAEGRLLQRAHHSRVDGEPDHTTPKFL